MSQFGHCHKGIAVLLVAALLAGAFSSCGGKEPSSEEIPESSPSVSEPEPSEDSVSEEPSVPEKPDPVESESSQPESQKSEESVSSEEAKQADASADNSYFDDAVFIGDSRTQGFIIYNELSNTTAYMDKGLKVDTAFTKEDIEVNGVKMSAMDALAQNTSFRKVYVMLGVNELGWAYSSIFIEKYGELVDRIKEINPDAEIYIQSILPVSRKKSESDQIYNMNRINEYNDLIKQMTADKGAHYLNVAEAVADGEGYLPEEASTDGVHLNKSYCAKWLDYLKTHTAEQIGQ